MENLLVETFKTDPLSILKELVHCRSVTPEDDGALAYIGRFLENLGFEVTFLDFGPEEAPTPNLYARLGKAAPFLCFAGHTDVVPPGEGWESDPFILEEREGWLYGRGVADMKGGIACFLAAIAQYLKKGSLKGSLGLIITGDEEGPAKFGTKCVLEWMKERGEKPDFCLVGEPTNPKIIGEMIKIGRRGSLNAHLSIKGVQGHVAYQHLAKNPIHCVIPLLNELTDYSLDQGSAWFAPSSLQITSLDVGNMSTNIIPSQIDVRLNIRFNDLHSGKSLSDWLHSLIKKHDLDAALDISISGEAFLTEPGRAIEALSDSINAVTKLRPKLDTAGGTSDARFITNLCAVAEFGLVNDTIHKCNEAIETSSLTLLTEIYSHFIAHFGV